MKNLRLILLIVITTLIPLTVSGQKQSKGKDFHVEIKGLPSFNKPQTINELTTEKLMMKAKMDNNQLEIDELQKQMDALTGSITIPGTPISLYDKRSTSGPPFQSDNINVSQVVAVSGLKAISLSTEQRGVTASRIWTVYGFDNGTEDAIGVKYSEDNGISWLDYTPIISFSTGNRINIDEIDTEIIEGNTGDKYLWIVFGYTNGSGDKLVGVLIVKITNGVNWSGYTLNWPGSTSNSRYYRPRICTDNAEYPTVPWVYIVACYDSTSAIPPLRGFSGKVARCNSPFTLTPSFTYKPEPIVPNSLRLSADVFYDIAYFENGDDSIAFVATGFQDTSTVSIHVSSIVSFTSSVSTVGTIHPNSRRRSHSYIASNGAYNRLMIVSRTRYSSEDWDIEYFTSLNGSRNWIGGNVDFSVRNSQRADIKEKWNSPGKFYCSYCDISNSFDSVSMVVCNNYVWGSPVSPVNHIDASLTTNPRPGFRFTQGDSSLALWSENTGTGTHVWVSGGSTGSIVSTGFNGTTTPDRYELFQNFPNPFNPTTNIKFYNTGSNIVELRVYDALGKEVEILVNETLPAGEYRYFFNGTKLSSGIYFYKLSIGNKYSQVRKMVLLK